MKTQNGLLGLLLGAVLLTSILNLKAANLTSLSPSTCKPGAWITLSGDLADVTEIFFKGPNPDDSSYPPLYYDGKGGLSFFVPGDARSVTYMVYVSNGVDGWGEGVPLKILQVQTAVSTSVSPASCVVGTGTRVTVEGNRLEGVMEVDINGPYPSDDMIIPVNINIGGFFSFTLPKDLAVGNYYVKVDNGQGWSNWLRLQVNDPPKPPTDTLLSVTPSVCVPGHEITLEVTLENPVEVLLEGWSPAHSIFLNPVWISGTTYSITIPADAELQTYKVIIWNGVEKSNWLPLQVVEEITTVLPPPTRPPVYTLINGVMASWKAEGNSLEITLRGSLPPKFFVSYQVFVDAEGNSNWYHKYPSEAIEMSADSMTFSTLGTAVHVDIIRVD